MLMCKWGYSYTHMSQVAFIFSLVSQNNTFLKCMGYVVLGGRTDLKDELKIIERKYVNRLL
jgi:hypothetical protein